MAELQYLSDLIWSDCMFWPFNWAEQEIVMKKSGKKYLIRLVVALCSI